MEYDIKSKPTIYKGTKYRSRLEARWAAMFDLLGWRYQYEPYDLNGWTPDFIVYGKDKRYILFEIKPFIDDDVLHEYQLKVYKNIRSDFWPYCIMLDNNFSNKDSGYGAMLAGYQLCGITVNYKPPDYKKLESWEIMDPFQVHWKSQQSGINSEYDIGSAEMAFDGLLWSSNNRKQFIGYSNDGDTIRSLWIEAGELSRFHYNG